jgi:hypothetical protein
MAYDRELERRMLFGSNRVIEQPVRKVLMIAYFFPPVGGIGIAGSQRVLKFAKYLPYYQWEPVILTAKENYYEPYLSMDYALLEKIPKELTIIRTPVIRWLTKLLAVKNKIKVSLSHDKMQYRVHVHEQKRSKSSSEKGWYQTLKDALTELFEIPDEEIGWLLPGVLAGIRAIKKEQIDIIYSTGRPWTAHLIGIILKFFTGKPLVVDFRDPWMTNPFRPKYTLLKEYMEAYCERIVVNNSDLVIANTNELKEEFRERFLKKSRGEIISLYNGFDHEDYSLIMTTDSCKSKNFFVITHTGFLYGKRDPKCFLDAVKLLIHERKLEHNSIRIFFVGLIKLNYDLEKYLISNDLDNIVILQSHVPYEKSLEYLKRSDVLLLLQPGTTTQVPSKLFDYIGMRKPILAVSPYGGATYKLIKNEAIGIAAKSESIKDIADAIYKMYDAWLNKKSIYNINEEKFQKFNIKNVTSFLAESFNNILVKKYYN